MKKNITLVTGLWDIKRNQLSEGWNRDFEGHYLKNFKEYLKIPYNLIIFGDNELRKFVEENKTHDNVQFIERDINWFKQQFYNEIQKIRTNSEWFNQVGWLSESTQAKLELYNPLVMSKVFLLHDAKIMDGFNSSHMFWLDAGITNTVHSGYFTHDKVLDKLIDLEKISFLAFPYETNSEIHGFRYDKINEYAGKKVDKVCRGGFFGGPKSELSNLNGQYYDLMQDTLNQGLMGTEESLFTILVYRYPQQYQYFMINGNGLVNKFFEDLKNGEHKPLNESKIKIKENNLKISNTALYVITFNSPKQFETLIDSFYAYDPNFVDRPQKFLINNSTDENTDKRYQELCKEYNFTEIRFKENLGICGGRQYIAEHAEENDFDFYFFFEDDMFFYPKEGEVCKNGFNRFVSGLYEKSLKIIKKNDYDFLKLSFSEFYGDNRVQWAWYNVPQHVREEYWPKNPRLPVQGLDPNAPKTNFKNINCYEGVPYADGEIYYSNWPQVVSKYGNRKMFLTEKWAHPYEQTWMSYIYQETAKGNINPGLLLISPTEHDRFDHYDRSLRKES